MRPSVRPVQRAGSRQCSRRRRRSTLQRRSALGWLFCRRGRYRHAVGSTLFTRVRCDPKDGIFQRDPTAARRPNRICHRSCSRHGLPAEGRCRARHKIIPCTYIPANTGPSICGDEGNRTPNPRLAKAVLCQLSYVPVGGAISASSPRWPRATGWRRPGCGGAAGQRPRPRQPPGRAAVASSHRLLLRAVRAAMTSAYRGPGRT